MRGGICKKKMAFEGGHPKKKNGKREGGHEKYFSKTFK